ncbi:PEGA domain-containing protein [Candidatus Gottesmanbacteria bacterium]|nr:PEGA domain-containing protein [Candidatus Gottesmanbacteria bacterium]
MVEKVKQATRRLISLVIVILILTISFAIIGYGRGWRLDITKKSVKPTGLVSATSQPAGAQVFVDGTVKTATNNAFNVDPGWYTIRIVKEGYLPWEKKLRVQGEVAIKIEASLFPANPSLSPLTTTGVVEPTLSPDGTKVAYIVPARSGTQRSEVPKQAGLWMLELSDRPLGPNRDPQLLAEGDLTLSLPDVSLLWSPDSREVIVKTKTVAHLYVVGKTQTPIDVSARLAGVLSNWESDRKTKEKQKLAGFPQEFANIASSSANILSFSPDETKILYQATASASIPMIIKPPLIASNPTTEARDITPGNLYVYDSKEDKNFFIGNSPLSRVWFPTSNHLMLSQNNKIDIMEYDAANRTTVYAGPFTQGFLAPWPNGSRLVIVTNLNPGPSTLPNLYTVNLR